MSERRVAYTGWIMSSILFTYSVIQGVSLYNLEEELEEKESEISSLKITLETNEKLLLKVSENVDKPIRIDVRDLIPGR